MLAVGGDRGVVGEVEAVDRDAGVAAVVDPVDLGLDEAVVVAAGSMLNAEIEEPLEAVA